MKIKQQLTKFSCSACWWKLNGINIFYAKFEEPPRRRARKDRTFERYFQFSRIACAKSDCVWQRGQLNWFGTKAASHELIQLCRMSVSTLTLARITDCALCVYVRQREHFAVHDIYNRLLLSGAEIRYSDAADWSRQHPFQIQI